MNAWLLVCSGLDNGRVKEAGERNMQGDKHRRPRFLSRLQAGPK